jgi:glycosyltransferase involved in cell wall biosynthesis
MAFGNCVIAYDTPDNLETIGDAGFAYDGQVGGASLRQVLQRLLSEPALVAEYSERARVRARTHYSWETVTDAYEKIFFQLCGKPLPERLR